MTRSDAEAIKSRSGLIVLRGFDDNTPGEFWLLDMTGPELEQWWKNRAEFWWPARLPQRNRLIHLIHLTGRAECLLESHE